jgi:hypothetical protein
MNSRMEAWDFSKIPRTVVRHSSLTVKSVEARLTLSCRCFMQFSLDPRVVCNEQVFILLNMESGYYIVTVCVI